MAKILKFMGDTCAEAVGDAASESNSPAASDGRSAQIIIFPGVRIERYDEDPFASDSSRSSIGS